MPSLNILLIILLQGFLIVPGFWLKEELEPCRTAAVDYVEQLAQTLYKANKITGMHVISILKRLFYILSRIDKVNLLLGTMCFS